MLCDTRRDIWFALFCARAGRLPVPTNAGRGLRTRAAGDRGRRGPLEAGVGEASPPQRICRATFVIDPAWQGRGIGRAALRRACEQLRAEGAHAIGLEVDVENDRALTLYTSVGFTPILTEDYFALPLS